MKLHEALGTAGAAAVEFQELLERMTETIKELETMVEETREDPEFEMHYEYHAGKAAGLEIAIELLTNKIPYKPPETIEPPELNETKTYQGGRNDND